MQEQQSMYCQQCVRKHLANAISYAKEILSGHGEGGDPDHRPDLLGELGNAEHHLQDNPEDQRLFEQVIYTRRRFEDAGYIPYTGMVTELRRLWTEVAGDIPALGMPPRMVPRQSLVDPSNAPAVSSSRYTLPSGLVSRAPVDVLILPGNSPSELEGVHKMIDNLTGVNEVFENALPEKSTDYILVWPAHTGIIRSMDAGIEYPMYCNQKDGTVAWDSKPQVVEAALWRTTPDLNQLMAANPLKWAFATSPAVDLSTKVDKICCGTKRKFVTGAYFVRWLPANWDLLKGSLSGKMEWQGR